MNNVRSLLFLLGTVVFGVSQIDSGIAQELVLPIGMQDEMPTYGLPNENGYYISGTFLSTYKGSFHAGVDLANGSSGGEVRAVADGTVVDTRNSATSTWGNAVLIQHENLSVYSLYAHMLDGSVQVNKGDPVFVGQTIGKVGSTGNSDGPHLHFEMKRVGTFDYGYFNVYDGGNDIYQALRCSNDPSRECHNDANCVSPGTCIVKASSTDYVDPLEYIATNGDINSSSKFSMNDWVEVVNGPVNVRATANGTLLGKQAMGNKGTIISTPTFALEYWWWRVDFESGPDGWVAEDFLINAGDPPPTNTPPNAEDDSVTAQSGVSVSINVLANDTDADGDSSIITTVTQGTSGGSVTTDGNNVTYTSTAGFTGTETFTYTISDGKGGSATATVTVTITAVEPPASYSIDPATISVSENAGTVTFTITRSNASAAQTVYVSTVQNQGSTNNNDYVGKLNEPVVFSALQDQQPVTFTIHDDTLVEGNETFGLIVQESPSDPIDTYLASATFTIIDNDSGSTTPTGKLNDTGITTCSDATSNGLACPVADYPGQDAQSGRDVTNNDDSDGHAGFSFTKLDSSGNPLPADATAWDCVKDNVTGLVWEVKTDDGGLRDKDWTYSWYEPDDSKNGGNAGTQNGGSCTGSSCDTQGYVQAVNAQGLCGASDWRMPTHQELFSIVSLDRINPAIDSVYFPNTPSAVFNTSSNIAYHGGAETDLSDVGMVSFYDGFASWFYKLDAYAFVRLVRGGQ